MPDSLAGLAWVALGSALGGSLRYFISGVVGRLAGETFPWGTMLVNVTGAFAIGAVAAAAEWHTALRAPSAWLFAVVGVLGSYTTVSSFSLQTLALARDRQLIRAGGNVLLSLALCLGAATLGAIAAAAIAQAAP